MKNTPFFAAVAVSLLVGFSVGCSPAECVGAGCNATGGGNGGTGGGTTTSLNCSSRCETKMTGCGAPASAVAQNCGSLCAQVTTEAQMLCLESQSCTTQVNDVKRNCGIGTSGTGGGSGSGGGSAGTGGGSSGTGGGAGMCIALAASGCSSLNAPSNCCTASGRPEIVCNGNNDGNGNAQCCVNPGKTCVQDSDCCGRASNPTLYKCCPNTNKCGFSADC